MFRIVATAALILAAGCAVAGAEQARSDSDWPCRQLKVSNLSLAAIWSGPPIDAAAMNGAGDPALTDIVARLAARRTPLEEAQKLVVDYAQGAGAQRKERLTQLFVKLYDKLDGERSEVVAGLERFGRAQKEFAQRVREEVQKLREAQDAHAEAEKLKELSQALQWDTRMFEERRKTTSFVCETPALIEQRLGALARMILAAME
jgi:hypothetical protein